MSSTWPNRRLNTNIILIDFENVQPANLKLLRGRPCRVKVFVGAHQTKIPFEMARELQALGPNADYIQIQGSGPNALDFHIAYYIGRLAAEFPDAAFHVVSRDTGFDPLIKHLGAQNIACRRSSSLSDFVAKAAPAAEVEPDRAALVASNLARRAASRPRTLKTLRTSTRALLGNQVSDSELDQVVDQLVERGVLTIAGGKVNYPV